MSGDSSSGQPRRPLAARLRAVLTPQKEWGIGMGILIGALALMAPYFLLEPLFLYVLPLLPASMNVKVSIITVVVELAAIGVIAAALMAYHKKFADIGVDKPRFTYLLKALLVFLLYMAVSVALQVLASTVFGEAYNADQPQELGYKALGSIEAVAAFVPLVLLTPLAEELIFRGFMFRGVRRKTPFWVAALAVSAIFGLVHGQWNVGLDVFAMSLFSCYLVEKTGSLWPSIFLHVIKNGVAFSLVYLFKVA